jgi:hypothetical protein
VSRVLLLKGKKGLFTIGSRRNNSILYFPDRSWKDAHECVIIGYDIVKDMATYAFIKAVPVTTDEITLLDIVEMSGDIKCLGTTPDNIYRIKVGDSDVIITESYSKNKSKRVNYVYYKANGLVRCEKLDIDDDVYEYYISKSDKSVQLEWLNAIKKFYSLTTNELRYEALFRAYSSACAEMVSITILDNFILKVVTKDAFFTRSELDTNYYYYTGSTLECLSVSDMSLLRSLKNKEEVDLKDVVKKAVECRCYIGSSAKSSYPYFSENIVRYVINTDNYNKAIYLYDATKFHFDNSLFEVTDLERALVEKSANSYENWFKSLAKCVHGNMLFTLSQYSLNNVIKFGR